MRSLWRLSPYLKKQKWLILGSALLAIPFAALQVGPLPLIREFLNQIEHAHDTSRLWIFPVLILGLYLLNFVVRFFHFYLLRVVIARVNQELKLDLFDHLMGLSADYFTAQSTGGLMSRVGSDPQIIDGGLNCINVILREPVKFLLLLGYVLHLNWRLTIITILILPPLAWVFSWTGKYLKRYMGRYAEENARLFSMLQESFTGVRMIKSFRLEGYVRGKLHERASAYTHNYLKIAAVEEAAHPLVELLMAMLVALMIYFGGIQIVQGRMTVVDLTTFFAAFAMMLNPLQNLNDVNLKLAQAAAACERIFEVFDWRTRLRETAHPRTIREFRSEIRLRDVRFAYPDAPERDVLGGVSFAVPAGKVIALVGPSGAGKSSLVSLIPRIFDVTGGKIEIDGTDIHEFLLSDLRDLIAVVSQDVFLFNDTIEANIRCGRLDATEAEVREAARRAHALDFIEAAPQGFRSVIGDRGQKLSGGERQRISIARAFLRHAPILILDEATSSLDNASERAVQAALEELMRDRTTLVIAHRLSTIRHADEILVLEEGRIVERGKHDELLQAAGLYAKLHQMSQR